MRFILPTTVLLLAHASCTSSQPVVEQFGAMRPVMRGGETQGRVSLIDATAAGHAIGVGAMEGLKGEITIVDGNVWVSRPDGNGLKMTGPRAFRGDQATLLTLAHVDAWASRPVTSQLQGAALEAMIEQVARDEGVDTTKPFPFVIEGHLNDLDLHVINGYCPIATDPSTVDAQPWHWSCPSSRSVIIVGFYATNAAGVMTHHGSSIHAHAITTLNGETITGHIDAVTVEPGMTIAVPMVN
jgi:acetolactate decarboxylase